MLRLSDKQLQLAIDKTKGMGLMSHRHEHNKNVFLALTELQERREDQSKYEKIIDDMAAEIADCAEIGVYCDGCKYFGDENEDCLVTSPVECRTHIIKYYKQRAGIKGEE